MKYVVKKGKNIFFPIFPIVPFFCKELHFKFSLGKEWWDGDLTEPLIYGCKLHACGKFNYHNGGANSAIVYESGKVYWYPRYYEPITSGTYKLHELSEYKIELKPDIYYEVKIKFDKLSFWFNNGLVCSVPITIPKTFLAQPFLGRSGNDNNYPDNADKAVAARDLSMNISFI